MYHVIRIMRRVTQGLYNMLTFIKILRATFVQSPWIYTLNALTVSQPRQLLRFARIRFISPSTIPLSFTLP